MQPVRRASLPLFCSKLHSCGHRIQNLIFFCLALVIQQGIKSSAGKTVKPIYFYRNDKGIVHCSHFSLAYVHQTAQVIYHSQHHIASLSVLSSVKSHVSQKRQPTSKIINLNPHNVILELQPGKTD